MSRRVSDAAALSRRVLIGQLLADPKLSLAQIGRRVDLSRERVRQIQQRYFPDTPPRPKFLLPQLPALRFGSVREFRFLHPPTPPFVYSTRRFRTAVARILAEVGAKHCSGCCSVKALGEFPAWARSGVKGHCRACNTAQMRVFVARRRGAVGVGCGSGSNR